MNDYRERLAETFITAAQIEGPTRAEQPVADWISGELKPLGWEVWQDTSQNVTHSEAGNVYAYRHASDDAPTLLFCAHMDTVAPPGDRVTVVRDGDVFRSDGTTILGADNRAGVAALVETARRLPSELDKNIAFFFPVNEEAGVMGASCLEWDRGPLQYVFNVDEGREPGVFIFKALGYANFSIEVLGRASHAAMEYDKGVNAIQLAGKVIDRLPLGVNKERGQTMNIGTIEGGTGMNVVPDKVMLKGEARAFKEVDLDALLDGIEAICENVTSESAGTVRYLPDPESRIPAFEGSAKSAIALLCEKICGRLGIEYQADVSYSSSDANWLSNRSNALTIIMGRGGRNPHAKNESIELAELEQTVQVLKALIQEA